MTATNLSPVDPSIAHASEIARLNDETRAGIHKNATIVMTQTLRQVLMGEYQTEDDAQKNLMRNQHNLLSEIRRAPIDPEDNFHGENDFGALTFMNSRIFWKIDYYANDGKFESGSTKPWDGNETYRVMTIMLASDY